MSAKEYARTVSRNISLLAVGQALTVTAVSLLTSLSALTGERLAPSAALSTLPVSVMVLGTLLMVYPASAVMARRGRRAGFLLKSVLGTAGSLVAFYAVQLGDFMLFCTGMFILGLFAAFGLYYRFAALEAAARLPGSASRALALVTGAGVAGGIAGPFLAGLPARFTADPAGADGFLMLTLVCLLLAVSQAGLTPGRLSAPVEERGEPAEEGSAPPVSRRPTGTAVATALSVLGFSSMTLVMNAAPLALHHEGFSLQNSAVVMQAHFMMMYLPAFAIPLVTRTLGISGLVVLGAGAGTAGCLSALFLPTSLLTFIVVLCLSGVSWSFLFNAGTLLFAEKTAGTDSGRAQGRNSLVVYGFSVVASFLSGFVMNHGGWQDISLLALILFLFSGLTILMRKDGQ